MTWRVSKDEFAELVEAALAELPGPFAGYLEEISIEICDRPSPKQARRTGGILLGLYHGRPRTQRSVIDSGAIPDVIYIFQANIEAIANSKQDLIRQVRTTVLHEIGHHFGMTEDDLEELGYQ